MSLIHVKSYGCSANLAEGEIMQGLLQKENQIVSEEKADTIVINICTVKGDDHALKEVRKVKQKYPEKNIVVSGCITRSITPKLKALAPTASLISTHNILKINDAIVNNVELLNQTYESKVNLPRVRKNPVIGVIPISNGCDSACTFCSTKLVKGALKSYLQKDILKEAENSIKEGCKEIWLTSQDNGCYGKDINTSLISLLRDIICLQGDFIARVGMANPKHVKYFAKELAGVLQHPKMFKFVHIPVQSGNNEILKLMKRGHTVEDYTNIITTLREKIPEITIATDIICGFPGETKQEFNQTLELLKQTKPDIVNISRFTPRPNTLAEKMKDQISGSEKKERSKELTKLAERISAQQNKKWLDWKGVILIDEYGKNNTFVGRNYAYKPVIVKGDFRLGEWVLVKITEATIYYLRGELV